MKIFSLKSSSGVTLIELMIAVMLISVVILGGGVVFYHGRVNIVRETHRRAALLVASQRLEELKAAEYPEISPMGHNPGFDPGYSPYYIYWGSSWDVSETPVYNYVTVDDLTNPKIFTQGQYLDEDGVGDSYDYVEVTVTVEWTDNLDNSVSLTTLIAPQYPY